MYHPVDRMLWKVSFLGLTDEEAHAFLSAITEISQSSKQGHPLTELGKILLNKAVMLEIEEKKSTPPGPE